MISFYKNYFRNMLEGNNMNRIFSAVIEMSAASIFIIPILVCMVNLLLKI